MATRAELVKEHEEITADAQKLMDEAGSDPSDEQLGQLREAKEKLTTLRTAIEKEDEKSGLVEGLRADLAEDAKLRAARNKPVVPAIYSDRGKQDEEDWKTPGEKFVDSDAYRGWLNQFPQGGPSGKATVFSDTVQIPHARSLMGMQTGTERIKARMISRAATLVTASDSSSGDLVRPYWAGLLEPGLVRPLTLRQLVTVIPVSTDAVEYAKEESRTSGAAPVIEATALTGTTGTKPQGDLVFALVTETVKTIAEWVAATKRILSDANGLRAYIDQFLMEDIAIELEDQMISGSGTGENFTGIMNTTPAIGDVGAAPAGGSVLDSIREAITYVRTNGRTNPTAVVLNPADSEKVDLLKVNAEVNHFVGPGPFSGAQPAIWGIPRVESEGLAAGNFLVGDFRRAVLFDREDTSISVGTAGDDFIRNIVRVLGEMRAAFGVTRPAAFCQGDVA